MSDHPAGWDKAETSVPCMAEIIVAMIGMTMRHVQSIDMQGECITQYNGERMTFAELGVTGTRKVSERRQGGRCLMAIYEFEDGSRIRYTWDAAGPMYVVALTAAKKALIERINAEGA